MRVAYQSDLFLPPELQLITILTDGAKIRLNNIHHDEENGVINIQLQRKELKAIKKSSLGINKRIYGDSSIVSSLTINQVEAMELRFDERLISECDSCFTLLFGVKMENNHIFLVSAEEFQGNQLCEIRIKVKQMDITLQDDH
jgi:hypothetical protein